MNFRKPINLLLYFFAVIGCAVLLFFLFFILFGAATGVYGVNKTVGWAWDICNVVPLLITGVCIAFVIGYGVLALLRAKISRIVSVLNLIFILLSLGSLPFLQQMFCYWAIAFCLLSLVMLYTNMVIAVNNKIRAKRNSERD